MSTATTAVETTTAASTMEAAAAKAAATAVEGSARSANRTSYAAARERVSTACITAASPGKAVTAASIADSTAIAYAAVAAAIAIAAAIAVAAATPVTAIPGAGADEEATDEPARSVVSVGCARVRSIRVIAPRTDWSRGIAVPVISVAVAVANANPYTDLGVSRSRKKHCGNHHGAEQQEIS
jgi:hypothetical protein